MKTLLTTLLVLASPAALAQELTPQQQRGRAIYSEGKGLAIVGGRAVAARLVPCASCHGDNGRGQREGGTGVADISPAALARASTSGERLRPAYTPATLRRTIAGGVDSAGQPLDRAMPRYQLAPGDAADLLSYLAILDTVMPSGVSDDQVRINVGAIGGLHAPAQAIYGRRIVLQTGGAALLTIDAGAPQEQQVAALRDYGTTQATQAHEAAAPLLLTTDCTALVSATTAQLVLMTASAAARCDLASIAPASGRRIVVAAPTRPGEETLAAQTQLDLAVAILSHIGRDFSRKRFTDAWTQAQQASAGKQQVWLMTLDSHQQALLAEPGWWRVPQP